MQNLYPLTGHTPRMSECNNACGPEQTLNNRFAHTVVLCLPVVVGFELFVGSQRDDKGSAVRRSGSSDIRRFGELDNTAHLRSPMCTFVSIRRQSDPVNTRLAAHDAL